MSESLRGSLGYSYPRSYYGLESLFIHHHEAEDYEGRSEQDETKPHHHALDAPPESVDYRLQRIEAESRSASVGSRDIGTTGGSCSGLGFPGLPEYGRGISGPCLQIAGPRVICL